MNSIPFLWPSKQHFIILKYPRNFRRYFINVTTKLSCQHLYVHKRLQQVPITDIHITTHWSHANGEGSFEHFSYKTETQLKETEDIC